MIGLRKVQDKGSIHTLTSQTPVVTALASTFLGRVVSEVFGRLIDVALRIGGWYVGSGPTMEVSDSLTCA